MTQPIFVTGTDTEIGKTWVTAGLLRGYARAGISAAGMKPLASGAQRVQGELRNEDALQLQACSAGGPEYEQVNPYCFGPPIAPAFAAREAGVVPEFGVVQAALSAFPQQRVLIEGAGGWLVSVNEREMWPDWVAQAGWPVVLVVGMRLGGLNHALLSAQAIQRDAHLLGWVANCLPPNPDRFAENLEWLERHLPAPRLATVSTGQREIAPVFLEHALEGYRNAAVQQTE